MNGDNIESQYCSGTLGNLGIAPVDCLSNNDLKSPFATTYVCHDAPHLLGFISFFRIFFPCRL